MIVVNYYLPEDYNRDEYGFGGYCLHLVAMANDSFDLNTDVDILKECLDNYEDFEFKKDVLYEIQFIRATISADPIPESAFFIDKINELPVDYHTGKGTDQL